MDYHSFRLTFVSSNLLISLILLVSTSVFASSGSCNFPVIFNFGDSNSDTGGFSAAFVQAQPPNGETYFNHPAGRYSDGRLVIDFIVEIDTGPCLKGGGGGGGRAPTLAPHQTWTQSLISAGELGLPYLSAFLDAVGANFSHGANFATAASTIRPPNLTLSQGLSPISLNVQWDEFSGFSTRSQLVRSQGGVFGKLMPKREDFARALYTFDIGQNDLATGYFQNMSTDQVRAYVPDVLDKFSLVIKAIYAHGGRYFWVHNTGPVGCLPYVLDGLPVKARQIDSVGCARPFNKVAQFFNHRLKDAIVQLRKDLPHAAITYVDVYSVKYSLISQATKYGFEEPLKACCGDGGKYNFNKNYRCGSKRIENGKEIFIGSCKDPKVKINWDGVHYTEAANKFIFDHIVGGSFSDPPIPLKMACHRQPN